MFPRVLVICDNPFCAERNNGMMLVSLFRGWPEGSIAQVYVESSNSIPPDFSVCRRYWKISPVSAVAGIFGRPKMCEVVPRIECNLQRVFQELPPWRRALVAVARYGWSVRFVEPARELLYGVRSLLSKPLKDWIGRFSPELVYSMLGTVHIMKLSLDVATEFDLPIAPHFTDDWLTTNYKRCWGGNMLRSRMQRHFKQILARAPIGLTGSEDMAEAYAARYGGSFRSFVPCVDSSQFRPPPKRADSNPLEPEPGTGTPANHRPDCHAGGVGCTLSPTTEDSLERIVEHRVRLLYLGGLHSDRWRALQEIGFALRELAREGYVCEFEIYTQPDAIALFGTTLDIPPVMRVAGWVPNHQVPQLVRNADILVHVESFEPQARKYVHLSMSTKIPEYMMAGRCIFAYGPSEVASIKYIQKTGAGITVGIQDMALLRSRLADILRSRDERERLGSKARAIALERHEATRERERFRNVLQQIRDCPRPSDKTAQQASDLSA
jgi:glycosyltransferase involved in cell wall biosynthesis